MTRTRPLASALLVAVVLLGAPPGHAARQRRLDVPLHRLRRLQGRRATRTSATAATARRCGGGCTPATTAPTTSPTGWSRAACPPSVPGSGTGMAYNWGRANSDITDQTPMVGSVAWWNKNGDGRRLQRPRRVRRAGASPPRKIVISEDSWSGDFHWRTDHEVERQLADRLHPLRRPRGRRTRPTRPSAARPRSATPLTATAGTWTPAATYAYQWLADGKADRRRDRATAHAHGRRCSASELSGAGRGHQARLRRRARRTSAAARPGRRRARWPARPPRRSPAPPRVDEVLTVARRHLVADARVDDDPLVRRRQADRRRDRPHPAARPGPDPASGSRCG